MGRLTVNQHHISFLNTLFSENSRKSLHLLKQLFVGIFRLRLRHWAVENNSSMIAKPRFDMSIHAVVTGGNLAVWEPFPMIVLNSRL
jgi:hypothetical protein